MKVAVDLEQLVELARVEPARFAARSPERRAAAHLYFALTEPPAKSIASARNAVASFGDERTQADALELLHRLAATAATAPKGTPA